MTADRTGLGFLGFIFGGVTAVVMFVAVSVVVGHADSDFASNSTAPAPIAQTAQIAAAQ